MKQNWHLLKGVMEYKKVMKDRIKKSEHLESYQDLLKRVDEMQVSRMYKDLM